jgi:hypothetical protein
MTPVANTIPARSGEIGCADRRVAIPLGLDSPQAGQKVHASAVMTSASKSCAGRRQAAPRSSPTKLAPATSANDQDHASPRANGSRSGPSRREYSGSSRNTISVMASEAARATAEPAMMPSSAASGFRSYSARNLAELA